jgi:hypothetical protein
MRIRTGRLFWGLLLIPLGAIPLLVRANVIDGSRLTDAWKLWPLVLVGIGLALLVRRGRSGLILVVISALGLGLLGGAAIASSGGSLGDVGDCVITPAALQHTTSAGTFGGPAAVSLELDCGQASVATGAGSGWTLGADYRGNPPLVSGSSSELRLSPPHGGASYQDWTLELPSSLTRTIELTANAGSATLTLPGATLDQVTATINAGDLRIDAAGAAVSRISIAVNAGRARVTLGEGPTTGSLSTNAGDLALCAPSSSNLILHVTNQLTFVTNLAQRGFSRSGDTWSRAGTGGSVIELSIEGTLGSFTVDPEGGC